MSLLCGVAFFFLYGFAAQALFPYVPYNTTGRFVLTLPLRWPEVAYDALPFLPYTESPALFFVMFPANVALFGLIAYALLAWSSRRRLKLS